MQLVRPTFANKLAILQGVGPGSLLGEEALLTERYESGAIAKTPSNVLVYPKEPLLTAVREYADLSEDLAMMLVHKVQTLAANLGLREIKTSDQRVLRYLRRLATRSNRNETVVQLDRPLKEIAEELGFAPETLSRALTKLEQEGCIVRTNSNIILHEPSIA